MVLLILVLPNGEGALQQSPGDPTGEWAAFPVFKEASPKQSLSLCAATS